MTKLITCAGALILYEEDHFRLNDPVSRFIPAFKDVQVAVPNDAGGLDLIPPKRKITIRDLFRHTSGLSYGFGFNHVDSLYTKAIPEITSGDLSKLVKGLTQLPLAWHPGTKWEYSFSTDVLGRLIEIVSGQPLDVFLKERLFRPLGMKDTAFQVTKEKLNRLVHLYTVTDDGLKLAEDSHNTHFAQSPVLLSGGGGLVSTTSDYARFLQMLLNRGELDSQRILGRKTVELMLTNHLSGIDPNWLSPGEGFGLGPAMITDSGVYGESGSEGLFWWAGIFNTYFFVDPREEMFAILMTQINPYPKYDLGNRLRIMMMQAIID